jgi:hypothetical protein
VGVVSYGVTIMPGDVHVNGLRGAGYRYGSVRLGAESHVLHVLIAIEVQTAANNWHPSCNAAVAWHWRMTRLRDFLILHTPWDPWDRKLRLRTHKGSAGPPPQTWSIRTPTLPGGSSFAPAQRFCWTGHGMHHAGCVRATPQQHMHLPEAMKPHGCPHSSSSSARLTRAVMSPACLFPCARKEALCALSAKPHNHACATAHKPHT